MRMAVDEPGRDRVAAGVDDRRARTCQGTHPGAAADGDEAPVPHGERLDTRRTGIDGVNVRVDDDKVGHGRRLGRRIVRAGRDGGGEYGGQDGSEFHGLSSFSFGRRPLSR
jgi:hypothetical protein